MKSRPSSIAHSDVAARSDLMRGLMLSVTTFMERTGMSGADIHEVFLQCASTSVSLRGKKQAAFKPSFAYGCDTVAGAVLRAWHKFPMYIDAKARPRRLRADGPEPNLASLILSQDGHAETQKVIQSMQSAGLIRTVGVKTYLPEKDAATIESLDPLAVDHIAKTVMRLVETATRNVAKSRDKLQLIERYAHVPDLTRSEAKAFATFSREQGQACLDAIEDWLEARQAKHANRSGQRRGAVNAGVHIFAYLGEPKAAKKRPVSTKVRRIKPIPEARA